MDDLKKLMNQLDPEVQDYLSKYVEETGKIAKARLIELSHELLIEFKAVKIELRKGTSISIQPEYNEDDPQSQKIALAEVWTAMESTVVQVNRKFTEHMEKVLREVLKEKVGELPDSFQAIFDEAQKNFDEELNETEEEKLNKLLQNLPTPPKGEMN